MNPHSEISPSTQLLLKELRKLRKLFDKFDAYVRESSRGVSIPTQCAIVGADIVADNWGGLFDGGNGSNEQQFEARSTVADNWGGLFEQPAHIPEERDLAFSAIDVFGSESSCLGSVLEFDLACPEQFDGNVAATEYTHSDPDVSACVTTAPTASAADSVAIWEVEPEESLPAEYPQQIQEPEEKRHDANIVALDEALSKREAEAGTRALAKPPRLRVSCRWRPLWRSVRFVSLERSDPILQTLRMCPTRKHGFHYPVRARVHRPRLPPVRQWPHGPRARTRALASRQGRRRHWSRRLRVRHRARHHAGVGADRHLPCPRRPPRRVRLPRWLLRALAAGPRLHRRRLRRLHPLRPRRPHHHGVPPLSSPPHRSANAIPHSDCLHGAALSLPTASLAGRLSQSALLCIDALVSLVLPGNRLFVTLPDTLPPHLHALDLPGNAISGGIPVSLVACESLNLPSTRCSMQVHYSNFSSGLLHPSPVAPVSTLPTPAVLMTMAPFPASTTASTAGVNFSSNIIHNQDTGWVLGKVAHKQLWPPPVQCEIRGDVVQMLICIAWISPDQNALEVLSFQVQQPWPPPTVFPLRPLPWPSFSNYAASVLCELKFDGVQSWPFFCSYAVLVHLNTSELAVLHWMSFGCIQTVECSLDWSFRIGTTTSGTSGAAFLVVTDDSSDHCTLLRQLDSAKAQRNLHMHAPGCLIVNHIILVPWKLWSWFNGYTSDMITQLLIPWSPCVWICSSALMITSSVLLRTLLLSQAVTLDFCSKLMLLAMGFLTTSKEVQYSTNCLSWTYSLSHEPFGTSLLITIAAMGSTMDSILECGLDKSKIVWNPGAQLRSFLHSNSLDAFKICYSLPRKPPWSLLAHHSFRTMHAKTVDSGKHMTVTTKVSFHMFIQEERQQKCGGPVGLAWHKDCLIVPKWLSDRVMACLILYGEAIPVFLCCVITTVLLLLEFLKLKENWQCAVSLVPTRLGVTRAGALLQEPMQKNHKESSSNTNVIMSTHRRTYNMRVTASSTVQAHPYLALWCLSDASFSLPSRPEKIATVGVGYIALEFAGDIKGLQSVVQAFKIWLHRPTRADYSVVISAMFSQLSIRLVGLTTDEVPKHEFQQFPWDPGGSVLLYRLGGKPILKKGGMLGISHDWAFTEAVGLAPAHTSPGTLDWRLQMPKANSGTDIEHYRTNSYQVANIAEQQQGPGIVACYQGTWVMEEHVLGIVALQQTFVPRSGDVVLVSPPKCGTTWLKALPFATMARGAYPPDGADHPLLRHNPHDCVPYM